jgi:hypothetical protein
MGMGMGVGRQILEDDPMMIDRALQICKGKLAEKLHN